MYFLYLLAAILPAIILVLYAYKQDQFPEPPKIVTKTFLYPNKYFFPNSFTFVSVVTF